MITQIFSMHAIDVLAIHKLMYTHNLALVYAYFIENTVHLGKICLAHKDLKIISV